MDIVVDASTAVRVLLADDESGFALQARLGSDFCIAPHLIDAEVGNVLRRMVIGGGIKDAIAQAGLRLLPSLIDERYSHPALAPAAWRLRHNLTYYDALYVALASRLGTTLLTADARLARAPGLTCAVELIG
jgi:predicted nucleic acid-binding protein